MRVTRTSMAAVVMVGGLAAAGGPVLGPDGASAWTAYVGLVEQRVAREERVADPFLDTDRSADGTARRAALRSGEVLVEEVREPGADGEAFDVPSALVHHWRGAVFVPGATIDGILARLADAPPGEGQPDVLRARVLSRTPDGLRVYLRVQRTKFVTVVYDTEHEVRMARLAPDRAATSSRAVRIDEIADAGTATERVLPPGEDHGFLWRWNAYWRYLQVPGGVFVECESVSLSRDVPAFVRALAGPLIRRTARESMDRTLVTFRDQMRRVAAPTPRARWTAR
ncbi:MAG: hypothetical protein R2752_12335 [Vicinamibacterales bacterium]